MTQEASPPAGAVDKPRVGRGNVEIILLDDGGEPETFTLKPSHGAWRQLSAQSGGLWGAIERISKLDTDAIVQIIAAGLSGGGARRGDVPKSLGERIYSTGLLDETHGPSLAAQAALYVTVLMNGGRMPPTQEEGSGEQNPPTG